MKVILRPLLKNGWGTAKYKHCYDGLGPYLTRSGNIYTGLTKEDEERLGLILGLDLRPSGEFWKNFLIRTTNKDIYLDTSDPMDELKYLFIKKHIRVKGSLLEHKASADFVIINKDEEAKVSNLRNRVIRDAFSEFDKLSSTDIRKVLRLYGENGDNMSAEVAEQRLFDLIDGNPQRFIDKWVKNDARETEVLLERAIASNCIRKNLNVYKYGSEVIGRSKEEVLNFLDDPINQDIKRSVLIELDAKDYISNREVRVNNTTKIQQLLDETEEIPVESKEVVEEVIKKSKK
jgi:hypothetical protein